MKPLQKRSEVSRPLEASRESARPEGGRRHTPVLEAVVVELLARPNAFLLDATVGDGGHAEALLDASGPETRLLGLDLDQLALDRARERLQRFGDRVQLVQSSFASLREAVSAVGWRGVDGILFDLGLRSAQLDQARGFSFRDAAAPLDMRFDASGHVSLPLPTHPALRRLARHSPSYQAVHILASLSAEELAAIFREYGDERYAQRIAKAVVSERRRAPLHTVGALTTLVVRAVPAVARHGRLHVATRVFQALRIAVNRERESLEQGLREALYLLNPDGRVAVISYHSGEDRFVKLCFREAAKSGAYRLLTPRPVVPSNHERQSNPRSRSAKLRVLEHTPNSHS